MKSCKLSSDSCSTGAVFTPLTFFKSLGTHLFREENLLVHQVNIFVKLLTVYPLLIKVSKLCDFQLTSSFNTVNIVNYNE